VLAFLVLISIASATQDSDNWNNQGIGLAKSGKSDEAIKAFGKAIKINPQSSLAWNNKGKFSTEVKQI
jgi:Flp pilus assembly protein TadD